MTRRAAQVRAGKGEVFEIKTDQFLQVSDMLGKQVAIMTAFNTEDHSEFLSTAHTRAINHSLLLLKDHGLYSNKRNKMMTVIEDTVGRHDILFPLDETAPISTTMALKVTVIRSSPGRCSQEV